MCTLHCQMINLSPETVNVASGDDGGLCASDEVVTLAEASENSPVGRTERDEVAHGSGQVDVLTGTASENKQSGLRSSGETSSDDDRRVGSGVGPCRFGLRSMKRWVGRIGRSQFMS